MFTLQHADVINDVVLFSCNSATVYLLRTVSAFTKIHDVPGHVEIIIKYQIKQNVL